MRYATGSAHAMQILERIEGVHVFSKPSRMTLNYDNGYGYACLSVIPYREHLDPDWFVPFYPSGLSGPKEKKKSLLLAHGYLEGECPEIAVDLPEDPIEPSGEWIRRKWLEGFDYAFVGHYHTPSDGFVDIHGCQTLLPGCPWYEKSNASGERGLWEVDLGKWWM